MHFRNLDEEKLVQHLTKLFPSKNNILGIGDDSAVIPRENEKVWLVTTDALVEGVHFLKDQIPANDLGYKVVAVNVSDIVAMGGKPKYGFLSIACPKTVKFFWVHRIIEGIKKACDKWNILFLGGDTVGSKRDVFVNFTIIGSAVRNKVKYRNNAKLGDIICVNGYLGNSGAGLKALQEKVKKTKHIQHLIRSHFHPEPSLSQGMWLASHKEVHAMMDISDGLDSDLKKLIKKSEKGAVIEINLIPISNSLSKISIKEGWDSLQFALVGGEDYCLLFTVASDAFEKLQDSFKKTFNCSLFPIGKIDNHINEVTYHKNGKKIQLNYLQYNHF
ncbi:MAG: thiamine-phosphate kinase [Candidatus Thorarchaeota archaeon]